MERKYKLRFLSGLVAFVMSGGISLATLPEARAEKIDISKYTQNLGKLKPGTFIEAPIVIDGIPFDLYVVEEGDHTSKISERYCVEYGSVKKTGKKWPVTTKYWPVFAYENDYPRIAQEGDVFLVPDNIQDTEAIRDYLEAIRWTSNYVRKNDVYGRNKDKEELLSLTVIDVLEDIFGPEICKEPGFVKKYLKTVKLSKLKADSQLTLESYVKLTIWIPTLEELGYGTPKKREKRR